MAHPTIPGFTFILLSLFVYSAHSQQYDETGEYCRKNGLSCPNDASKPYEKYCCIEVYNRVPYPTCCSPYFGIEIGAGIGIPVVLLLVITIIAAYCCCLKIQQRRLASHHLLDNDSEDGEQGDRSRQQYSELEDNSDKPPSYSTEDPFPVPPAYTPPDGTDGSDSQDTRHDGENDSNINIVLNVNPTTDVVGSRVSIESSDSDANNITSSNEDSNDRAPLIGMGVNSNTTSAL